MIDDYAQLNITKATVTSGPPGDPQIASTRVPPGGLPIQNTKRPLGTL